MNQLVRVGIDTPFVEPIDESPFARKQAIKAAMVIAVEQSDPGDVIAQDDMVFYADPFDTPLNLGTITMLQPQSSTNPKHWCPQAFRYASIHDGKRIIGAWTPMRRYRACFAWWRIPKQLSSCAIHPSSAVT